MYGARWKLLRIPCTLRSDSYVEPASRKYAGVHRFSSSCSPTRNLFDHRDSPLHNVIFLSIIILRRNIIVSFNFTFFYDSILFFCIFYLLVSIDVYELYFLFSFLRSLCLIYFLGIYVLKVGSYVNAYKQINLARTLVVSRLHSFYQTSF